MTKFLIFFLLLSCSTPDHLRPVLKTEINYQKDLEMTVTPFGKEPKTIVGIGVIPQAKHYKIKIMPPGEADMITVVSCHREMKTPNPEKHGGWFSKKYYEFEITPTREHEVASACSFDAGVYEKEKGRHAWGLLVIDDRDASLPAVLKCNGKTRRFGGTSVCQAKRGLIESIHFKRQVIPTETEKCRVGSSDNGKDWIFEMPPNECVFYFVDKKNPQIFHKAVFYGYDVIPIRGIK